MAILACAALEASSVRAVTAMRKERITFGLQAPVLKLPALRPRHTMPGNRHWFQCLRTQSLMPPTAQTRRPDGAIRRNRPRAADFFASGRASVTYPVARMERSEIRECC